MIDSKTTPKTPVTPSFRERLARLALAVEEQVTPSNLDAWCRTVLAHLEAFDDCWRGQRASNSSVCRSMLAGNPANATRVERLQTEEARLISTFLHMRRLATSLAARLGDQSPGRREQTQHLREDLRAWIAGCRAFERELLAWFHESVWRDEGAGEPG